MSERERIDDRLWSFRLTPFRSKPTSLERGGARRNVAVSTRAREVKWTCVAFAVVILVRMKLYLFALAFARHGILLQPQSGRLGGQQHGIATHKTSTKPGDSFLHHSLFIWGSGGALASSQISCLPFAYSCLPFAYSCLPFAYSCLPFAYPCLPSAYPLLSCLFPTFISLLLLFRLADDRRDEGKGKRKEPVGKSPVRAHTHTHTCSFILAKFLKLTASREHIPKNMEGCPPTSDGEIDQRNYKTWTISKFSMYLLFLAMPFFSHFFSQSPISVF